MKNFKINEVKVLESLNELKLILEIRHDVTIAELDKLENIVKDKNYAKSNFDKNFSSAFRRVQEIGIYDENVDRLFKELYNLTLIY